MPVQPTSPRLSFHPLGEDDVELVHRHWNDPDVRRHLWDDRPVAIATVREVVAASVASFAEAGYGLWALDDARGFVGTCGLRPIDDGGVEVLYSIEPSRWGVGLATEAARAVVGHAFAALDLPRILGGVDDANHASRRVLEKLGMTPLETAADGPAGVRWLAIERPCWPPTSA